jgi:ribonuclease P protein component
VCRLNRDKFPEGYDYILLARRNIVGLNYGQVEETLLKLLQRL